MHIPERRRPWTPMPSEDERRALRDAAPRDLQELLPILVERDRIARDAARKAADELAECLLQIQERGA